MRDFDLIVFGATGYTGRLVAEALLEFPEEGRLPEQRPRPSRKLNSWLNWSVRSLALQLMFSIALSFISFTARIVAVGMVLNPLQVLAEFISLVGAL